MPVPVAVTKVTGLARGSPDLPCWCGRGNRTRQFPAIACDGRGMDVDRIADLERWEESGAHWQVIARTSDSITIALLRCDGGEEVERFTSADPRLLEFVGTRSGSEDSR